MSGWLPGTGDIRDVPGFSMLWIDAFVVFPFVIFIALDAALSLWVRASVAFGYLAIHIGLGVLLVLWLRRRPKGGSHRRPSP